MDISQIVGFIQLIPLGVCLCLGYVVKHLIPNDSINRFIPLMMAVIGLVIEVWMVGSFTPEVMLTGIVSGLASSGFYEAFANLIDNGKTSADEN